MRQFAKITICVASALALYGFAQAGDSVPAANPYTMIAMRNAFGLLRQEVIVPPPAPEKPLPKIVLTGTMTVFGQPQIIFKVVVPKNSPAAKPLEDFFVLAEGERQDESGSFTLTWQ